MTSEGPTYLSDFDNISLWEEEERRIMAELKIKEPKKEKPPERPDKPAKKRAESAIFRHKKSPSLTEEKSKPLVIKEKTGDNQKDKPKDKEKEKEKEGQKKAIFPPRITKTPSLLVELTAEQQAKFKAEQLKRYQEQQKENERLRQQKIEELKRVTPPASPTHKPSGVHAQASKVASTSQIPTWPHSPTPAPVTTSTSSSLLSTSASHTTNPSSHHSLPPLTSFDLPPPPPSSTAATISRTLSPAEITTKPRRANSSISRMKSHSHNSLPGFDGVPGSASASPDRNNGHQPLSPSSSFSSNSSSSSSGGAVPVSATRTKRSLSYPLLDTGAESDHLHRLRTRVHKEIQQRSKTADDDELPPPPEWNTTIPAHLLPPLPANIPLPPGPEIKRDPRHEKALSSVFNYLLLEDLARVSQVSKEWNKASKSCWKSLFDYYDRVLGAEADTNMWLSHDLETAGGEQDLSKLTVNQLVARLTPNAGVPDVMDLSVFLMTYKAYITTQQLVRKLLQRYNVPLYDSQKNKKFQSEDQYKKLVVRPIQLRVCRVLKNLIEKHWLDFDPILMCLLKTFIRGQMDTVLALALANAVQDQQVARRPRKMPEDMKEEIMKARAETAKVGASRPSKSITGGKGTKGSIFERYSAEQIAEQLTLIEFEYFKEVKSEELMGQAYSKEKEAQNEPKPEPAGRVASQAYLSSSSSGYIPPPSPSPPAHQPAAGTAEAIAQDAALDTEKHKEGESKSVIPTATVAPTGSGVVRTPSSLTPSTPVVQHSNQARKMIDHFNEVSRWVQEQILEEPKYKNRAKRMEKLIQIAHNLFQMNNFETMMAVIMSFSEPAINRLHHAKAEIRPKYQKMLDELRELMSPDKSYANYRNAVMNITPPCIPYIGIYLRDLVYFEEGASSKSKQIVNFKKHKQIYEILYALENYQKTPYTFPTIEDLETSLQTFAPYPPGMDYDKYKETVLFDASLKLEPRGSKKSDIQ